MPAVRLYGRRWHFSSDILPLPACLAGLYNISWVVTLLVGAAASEEWPGRCESWQGAAYVEVFALFLAGFGAGLAVDAALLYYGLQGERAVPAWALAARGFVLLWA